MCLRKVLKQCNTIIRIGTGSSIQCLARNYKNDTLISCSFNFIYTYLLKVDVRYTNMVNKKSHEGSKN